MNDIASAYVLAFDLLGRVNTGEGKDKPICINQLGSSFIAEKAAEKLRDAFLGQGTNRSVLITTGTRSVHVFGNFNPVGPNTPPDWTITLYYV